MKSKKLTLTLALLGGSAGADRFYLGQNSAGWLILLIFWALIPGAIYGVIRFNLYPNWEPFLLAKYALPVLWHVIACGRYLVMSDEKFMSQNVSNGKTFPMVVIGFATTAILAVGGSKLIGSVQVVDIVSAEVQAVLSAEIMSQEFRANEDMYRDRYDNKVLQIEGIVTETGNDFELGAYFALRGQDGDPFGIKCFFLGENIKATEQIIVGDKVVIKGVANGNKLENSKVISVNGNRLP